jgi:nascent polypeptide-associated complex subunit beta
LCVSGKGTVRRKIKKVHKSSGTDEKKLQQSLKKLNVQPIQAIEEVNMFKGDGTVIHFSAPKGMCMYRKGNFALNETSRELNDFPPVHSAISSNLFSIYGNAEEKELTELVPGILNQLGPDSLASLRKLAESYQNINLKGGEGKEGEDDDDEIPNLVGDETFEDKAAEVE